jgi:integrase/recombinase XerD
MSADVAPNMAINARTLLPPAIQAWVIYLDDQGNAENTVKAFTSDLGLLEDYLPADQAIGSITTNDLNNFLNWMQNERGVPCSPKTLARRITSLKAFFRWLQGAGAILADPAERVVQKSVLSPLPDVLSVQEVDVVLGTAERMRRAQEGDSRHSALAGLLLATGIKKAECLALTTSHVDLEAAGGPLLFVRYKEPRHRYKERKIALAESWLPAYEQYRQEHDLSEGLFPWSPRRLEYLLQELGEAAGLDKQLGFLTCRWTCALNDMNSGMEEEKIRQKLGVSEIQWREVGMKLKRLQTEQDLQQGQLL